MKLASTLNYVLSDVYLKSQPRGLINDLRSATAAFMSRHGLTLSAEPSACWRRWGECPRSTAIPDHRDHTIRNSGYIPDAASTGCGYWLRFPTNCVSTAIKWPRGKFGKNRRWGV